MPLITQMKSMAGVPEAISEEGELVLAVFFSDQHRYCYIYKALGVMIPGCTVPHGGVAALRSSSSTMHGSSVGSRELAVFRNFMGLNLFESKEVAVDADARRPPKVSRCQPANTLFKPLRNMDCNAREAVQQRAEAVLGFSFSP